jgi:hypothetical protein
MTSKNVKTSGKTKRLLAYGRATEKLMAYNGSSTQQMMLINRLIAAYACNVPLQSIIDEDDLTRLTVISEHYYRLFEIGEKYNEGKEITQEQLNEQMRLMND